MSKPTSAVAIEILDKEYMVSCPEEEREDLLASARYLDRRLRETRDGGKVLGTERVAVVTALNIVHELLKEQSERERLERVVKERVRRLEDKLDIALGRRPEEEAVD